MIRSVFESSPNHSLLDRKPFILKHGLLGHDSLSLATLSQVVTELPAEQVFYSSGLVDRNANFDRAHLDHTTGLSLKQTMDELRTANSYVMVRAPEKHPAFLPIFRELKTAIQTVLAARGAGDDVIDPMLYLFLASPNSITPFHIDRYSTMLFQFQGTKSVYVYPPFDERLVTSETAESFAVWAGGRPKYNPALDHLATEFAFSPGEVLHIPFLAPHHVRNGPDEVSISLSIIFNTRETAEKLAALRMNHNLRRVLGKVGVKPQPIGTSPFWDSTKARTQRVLHRIRGS